MTDFLAGQFVTPSADGVIELRSPADLDDVVGRHTWSFAHVDLAVQAARDAFPSWRRQGVEARATLLRAYQLQLRQHADELARIIAREIGKPLWEAKTEVQAMVTKVDVTLGEGLNYVRDVRIADLPGEIRQRPHGVAAVIGPFNFPGHLPNGQLVPALLMGNTVVFKPSEKAPGTAELVARCLNAAGFPRGVVNVVQGAHSSAEKLSTHPGIDALLFTGSAAVGRRIVEANAHRPGLLVALELGGKNATLVFDDCSLERTARELAFSAYATAGQRCTCTSRVIVTRGVAERLVDRLAHSARSLKVGHVFDADVFMGPVISESTRQRLLSACELGRRSGFEGVVPGGLAEMAQKRGYYVRPSLHLARSARAVPGYTDTELFAPDLAVQVVDSVDEAIAVANDTEFGLSASVFTERQEIFERCADELRVGVLHWNRSSAGASGRLPFGGIRASGNHRPAGILMAQSCTYPMGVLLPPTSEAPLPSWPGLALSE